MTGDGLGRGLSDMWRSVLLFIPAAVAFATILLVGYLVARLLRTAVGKGLRRAGFDRAVERGPAGRMLRSARVSPSDLGARIVFYGVLLFALQLAFGLWGPNPVSDLLTALIAWLPRAFVAIVVLVVAAALAGAGHDLVAGALGGLVYGRLLARAVAVTIVALGVIAALDQVRIATSVTRPLLIAVLATAAGVTIVGVGGGLIRPMQQRWEGMLDRAGEESAAIREHARAYAAERARQEAQEHARREAVERARAEAEERARTTAEQAYPAATHLLPSPTQAMPMDAADETQVIPPPRRAGRPVEDDEGRAGRAVGEPGPDETVVIGGVEDDDRTQVIRAADVDHGRTDPER
jgi:Conserved TM helix